jgi:hypothetical protein
MGGALHLVRLKLKVGLRPIADGRSSKLGTAKLSLATAELKRQFVFRV